MQTLVIARIASNSRFKLLLHTINLLVKTSLIAIETVSFYSHFRYSPESSTFFIAYVMACATVSERVLFAVCA